MAIDTARRRVQALPMALREFLEHPPSRSTVDGPHAKIGIWQAAVALLVARFKSVLGDYSQLRLLDWNVLREHAGIRYSVEALTIDFDEAAITLEPSAIEPDMGILGRVVLSCGVRSVHLDCGSDGKLWSYRWVIPREPTSSELTDLAIETLVEDLLKSST